MIFKIIGSVGTILALIVNIPQVIKMIRTKKSKDVSLWTYVILFMTCICNFIYVLSLKDIILIIRALIGVTSALVAIIVWWIYKPENKRI